MSWKRDIGSKIRELRIVCCQTSAHSLGARQFVTKNYLDVMDNHPYFSFIVRECKNAQPTVMARYDYGVERRLPVEHMSSDDIETIVEELINEADEINSYVA
ncbi:unnamed protein product [Moneuplotes crassus]|uniref:Ribosomal protein/NADH dehydrogenase domain-containing protein n=1 Tax=Euplotes crassus TaxID=5936 RepID=A0AAD2D7L2_EUPCR|nr:unnamed protein product [Moneuplotes crassus]